jgi:hypothetical protein
MKIHDMCLKVVWERPADASDGVLLRVVSHGEVQVPMYGTLQIESHPIGEQGDDDEAPVTSFVVMPETEAREVVDLAGVQRLWDELKRTGARMADGAIETWILASGEIVAFGAYASGSIGAGMQDGTKYSDTLDFMLLADVVRFIDNQGVAALDDAAGREMGEA